MENKDFPKNKSREFVKILVGFIMFIAVSGLAFAFFSNYIDTYVPSNPVIKKQDKQPEKLPETSVQVVKVAFIGDQGLTENSHKVLKLIKKENADLVMHQGDYDYENNPDKWFAMIDEELGPDFPYFASIGNHDDGKWQDYQARLVDRYEKTEGAECTGDLGVKSFCQYLGINFVLLGVGTLGSDFDGYTTQSFKNHETDWKICSWHKNQHLMQTGGKTDEVGWEAYEECRKNGAIIATAHEHAYARTHLLYDIDEQKILNKENTLELKPGQTFVFVSGLGGHSIRPQNTEVPSQDWWASVYTTNQNGTFGALFCEFNYNSDANQAHCYFKDINDKVIDDFYIKK